MAVDGKIKKVSGPSENKAVKFYTNIKSELKRITWPSKEDTKKATIAVFIFIAIWVAITSLFDYGFENLLKFILKL